jgi:hypothetical protein
MNNGLSFLLLRRKFFFSKKKKEKKTCLADSIPNVLKLSKTWLDRVLFPSIPSIPNTSFSPYPSTNKLSLFSPSISLITALPILGNPFTRILGKALFNVCS